MSNSGSIVAFVGIFLVMAIVLLSIFAAIYPISAEGFKYKNEVRSHMENAYYAADPDTMMDEIQLAKSGMQNLGLTENMYSGFFPWEKTADKSMSWQYKHIDSIISRINEFRQWEASQSVGSGSSQQMKDVYTEKLDNVRSFINEDGWSDDIAETAYKLNFGFAYFIAGMIAAFLIILLFIIAIVVYNCYICYSLL